MRRNALYVTNGMAIVAFDVQPDGRVKNQRVFGNWRPAERATGWRSMQTAVCISRPSPGVQVLSPEGKFLGVIPAPRSAISVAFSGPDKKTLYVVGAGALGPDGNELRTPEGVRNNAKTIYGIAMLAQGFRGRAK